MLTRIVGWLAAPKFDDESKTRAAKLLDSMLWGLVVTTVVVLPTRLESWILSVTLLIVAVVLFVMLRRGLVRISSAILVSALWISVAYLAYSQGGIRSLIVAGFFLVIAMAGLLLGKRATLLFGGLSILAVVGGFWGERVSGPFEGYATVPEFTDLVALTATLLLATALFYVSVRSTEDGLERAHATATQLSQSNQELQEIRASLEWRVAERVHDLQSANQVSQLTTMVLDLDRLLPQVVELVRERFGLYYVGLFLKSAGQRDVVLRAGTGQAGQEMLAQGWSLAIGSDSMIGQCIAQEEAQIALDVGVTAVRFDNPLLPETRSEMALPLRARGQVLGAMTVQSDEEARFDEGDIAVMQGIADQVAIAIDNARLFTESQNTLQNLLAAQRRFTADAWMTHLQTSETRSYETEQKGTSSIGDAALYEIQQALDEERVASMRRSAQDPLNPLDRDYAALVAPILVRGQVIGALGIHDDDKDRQWTEDDLALLEAVLERMGSAAENLRLLDDTQRREANERLVREISDKMRRASDMDALIRTTVQEMAAALGTSDAFLQLGVSQLGGQVGRANENLRAGSDSGSRTAELEGTE